jgi:hypothetical protein
MLWESWGFGSSLPESFEEPKYAMDKVGVKMADGDAAVVWAFD